MTQDPTGPQARLAQSLEEMIRAFVLESPLNRLRDLDGGPIYEEPLVGFADGDDPLFQEYKSIIGDFHLTPREAMERHLSEEGAGAPLVSDVSVISWVLPIARDNRVSNRRMTKGPSLRWNQARWHGQTLAEALSRQVVSALTERGFRAVAPDLMKAFQVMELPTGRCSNWSQRHVAYAAGLGTFGLTDAFITPKGVTIWCSSVVTDARLPASPRSYSNHTANCPFYVDGSCGACIQRCPAGAITAQGHDKVRC
ncbi:MAG: epoxyqueuosine reductase, partial [Dehalococcoidia bacterium]|nr:epoxyqueuosine reductase [Dehalococcoidia bacterium]